MPENDYDFLCFDWKKHMPLFIAVSLMSSAVLRADALSSNEEKIRIIREIVAEELEGGKDIDADHIYQRVAQHMPLDPGETEASRALLAKWEKEALEKYPGTDEELTAKFRAEAYQKFPTYMPGAQVKIECSHDGRKYIVSGKFSMITENFVFIGSKKIPREDFSANDLSCFDPGKVPYIREWYIRDQIRIWKEKRQKYVAEQRKNNSFSLKMLQGKILYEKRYFSARKLTSQFIQTIQKEQNREFNQRQSKILSSVNTDERIEGLEQLLKDYKDTRFEDVIRKRIAKEEDNKRQEELDEKLNNVSALHDVDARIEGLEQLLKDYKDTRFESVILRRIAEEDETKLNQMLSSCSGTDSRINKLEQLLNDNNGPRFEAVIRTRLSAERDKREAEKRRVAEERRRAEEEAQRVQALRNSWIQLLDDFSELLKETQVISEEDVLRLL